MLMFVASLALQGDLLDDAKIGALVGSLISAILGCVLLLIFMPKRPEALEPHEQKAGDNEIPVAQVSEQNTQDQSGERWREDGRQGGFDKV
jgi:hypothetical protein